MADGDEPDEAAEDGDDPEAGQLVGAAEHVVDEGGDDGSAEAPRGGGVEGELAARGAAAEGEVAAGGAGGEAAEHEGEVAGVGGVGDGDGGDDEDDVEGEEPGGLEEAGEEAEEGAEGDGRDEEQGLVVAAVELVGDLREQRRYGDDARCPRDHRPMQRREPRAADVDRVLHQPLIPVFFF